MSPGMVKRAAVEGGAEPAVTSQILTVLSAATLTKVLPSRENSSDRVSPAWPCSVRNSLPSAASHSLMVLSRLPVANSLPSSEKAAQVTASVCFRSKLDCMVAGFQRRTVLSSPPLATVLPSAEYTAKRTLPLWPRKVACGSMAMTDAPQSLRLLS